MIGYVQSHRLNLPNDAPNERVIDVSLPVPEKYHDLMNMALADARLATQTGDVPVAALAVTADGRIIGRGRNERERDNDPTAHAEILAIRAAAEALGSWRLTEVTLVVTLEPCVMCAGAILAARIPRVVFGAWDVKAGAAGSVHDLLRDRRLNHQVEVISGVEEEACGKILTDFFRDKP
jgi:tRNA(adenine34) deaminase